MTLALVVLLDASAPERFSFKGRKSSRLTVYLTRVIESASHYYRLVNKNLELANATLSMPNI